MRKREKIIPSLFFLFGFLLLLFDVRNGEPNLAGFFEKIRPTRVVVGVGKLSESKRRRFFALCRLFLQLNPKWLLEGLCIGLGFELDNPIPILRWGGLRIFPFYTRRKVRQKAGDFGGVSVGSSDLEFDVDTLSRFEQVFGLVGNGGKIRDSFLETEAIAKWGTTSVKAIGNGDLVITICGHAPEVLGIGRFIGIVDGAKFGSIGLKNTKDGVSFKTETGGLSFYEPFFSLFRSHLPGRRLSCLGQSSYDCFPGGYRFHLAVISERDGIEMGRKLFLIGSEIESVDGFLIAAVVDRSRRGMSECGDGEGIVSINGSRERKSWVKVGRGIVSQHETVPFAVVDMENGVDERANAVAVNGGVDGLAFFQGNLKGIQFVISRERSVDGEWQGFEFNNLTRRCSILICFDFSDLLNFSDHEKLWFADPLGVADSYLDRTERSVFWDLKLSRSGLFRIRCEGEPLGRELKLAGPGIKLPLHGEVDAGADLSARRLNRIELGGRCEECLRRDEER